MFFKSAPALTVVAQARKKVELVGVAHVIDFLKKDGYSIVDKNFNARVGEIDLVAQKGELICFVEVKTRSNPKFPICNTVDYSKQKKIALAARVFCANKVQNKEVSFRFDVATVDLSCPGEHFLNYIANAFTVPTYA